MLSVIAKLSLTPGTRQLALAKGGGAHLCPSPALRRLLTLSKLPALCLLVTSLWEVTGNLAAKKGKPNEFSVE